MPHLHLAALKYLSRLIPLSFLLKQNRLLNPTTTQRTFFSTSHKAASTPPPITTTTNNNKKRVQASKGTQNAFQEARVFQRCWRMSQKMCLPFCSTRPSMSCNCCNFGWQSTEICWNQTDIKNASSKDTADKNTHTNRASKSFLSQRPCLHMVTSSGFQVPISQISIN